MPQHPPSPIALPMFPRAQKRKNASLQVLCLPLLRTPCRVTPLFATHTQTPGVWGTRATNFSSVFHVSLGHESQVTSFQPLARSLSLFALFFAPRSFVFNHLQTLWQKHRGYGASPSPLASSRIGGSASACTTPVSEANLVPACKREAPAC